MHLESQAGSKLYSAKCYCIRFSGAKMYGAPIEPLPLSMLVRANLSFRCGSIEALEGMNAREPIRVPGWRFLQPTRPQAPGPPARPAGRQMGERAARVWPMREARTWKSGASTRADSD